MVPDNECNTPTLMVSAAIVIDEVSNEHNNKQNCVVRLMAERPVPDFIWFLLQFLFTSFTVLCAGT
tara:strand:- start:8233 stop:8430 length:198 start_codon:yes stop_codon:yes gene_type:complete